MIGDKYIVKENCCVGHHNISLKKGEVLVESAGFNHNTEQREDCGDYNDLVHSEYGFICEVGSCFAKKYLVIA